MGHLDLLQGIRDDRVSKPDPMKLAAYTMEDCCQVPDAESCGKLADALSAAYILSDNLGKVAKNKKARLEKRANDWGDIMQLYYLCDESMHFITFDEKSRNQTSGATTAPNPTRTKTLPIIVDDFPSGSVPIFWKWASEG